MADTDITSNLSDTDVVIIYRPLTSTSKRKAMRTNLGVLKQVILANAAVRPDGKSAYELAVQAGYAGTQADWLTSLRGIPGAAGNKIRIGSGAPSGPSTVGDVYVDTVSWDVYSYV